MLSATGYSSYCIAELLQNAEQQLQTSESARLDAEVLLCHVTNIERSGLYAHPELVLEGNIINSYLSLIEARKSGQPVAYLTGHREFWSRQFVVNEHTLIPRPDTECLVATALDHIPAEKPLMIADLGTGCGNVAICIASERPRCHVTATDISSQSIHIAKQNADRHHTVNITFLSSNWFENISGRFYMIVSNPPYIKVDDEHIKKGDVQHEPELALIAGEDGLDSIRQIINLAPDHLLSEGYLLMEHGYDQGETVRRMLAERGFSGINTVKDFGGNDRVSFGIYIN